MPPLLVLNSVVELASRSGMRRLRLAEFVLGNRRTACRPDEILSAIIVPATGASGRSAFVKLGTRRYLVISIAMVAARLDLDDDGRIRDAAVAVGACSVVAMRLPALEANLIGQHAELGLGSKVDARHLSPLSPIDDVRGSAAYRLEAARELIGRALDCCVGERTRAA
jgi:CO/xanthine dehydrogenase FAD-binding subunit